MLVTRVQHVERTEQIDVDHCLKRIRTHPQRRRQKVACRARQHNVDLAECVAAPRKGLGDFGVVAHVAGHANCIVPDGGCGRRNFLFAAADDHHLGPCSGIALRNTQVDA